MVAGGYVTIPLTLQPIGPATRGAGDFVTLGVRGIPADVYAQPSAGDLNLC